MAAQQNANGPDLHFGLCTYLVGADMDLPTLIDVCERSGMEGLEPRTTHAHGIEPSLDAGGRGRVREQFDRTNVKLHTLGTACEFHSADPDEVRRNIEQTIEFIGLAADIGAVGVKVRPNGLRSDVPEDQTLRQIGEAAAECGQAAEDEGVEVYIECHGKDTQEPSRMARIMEHCGHPAVGLCWNCNPGDVRGGSIAETFPVCRPWVRHVHIHTLTNPDVYPWPELFGMLKEMNFRGWTMIETKPEGNDPVTFLTAQREEWDRLVSGSADR